ncbi:16554_t:CDS:2 [Funneliformis caledonium]|uniref:16554_t:CDS:1 n=1 Tax=Funneliformis caledonium TaxID=1117310 RepID=A0A9N9HFL4_9GLOM|nr:16554_t:CDS:2 [Funneliformis caledonium]
MTHFCHKDDKYGEFGSLEQNNNNQSQQPEQNQNNNGFIDFFLPFMFGEQQNRSRNTNIQSTQTSNNNQNGSPQPPQPQGQVPQFHFYVFPMPVTPGGDGQATPNVFFFTPFFMPQEVQKPRASESFMKKLPVVTITKEHFDAKASCPICFDLFSLSDEQKENTTDHGDNEATVTTEPSNSPSINSHSDSAHCSTISCALANVGCCEEIDNNLPTPIITLPRCHHRFHVSCLRTSLLVEGYSLRDINSMSRTLDFRCPTCRAPAILQSDVLKVAAAPNENESANSPQSEQQVFSILNLPLTINLSDLSDSDDMDLD